MKVYSLIICIIFLLSSAGWAADKGQEGFEAFSLGEIYVKGEKTPVTEETAITTVITAEDIKATNSRTVAEALSFAPGLSVTTGRKNEPNVAIHGFFSQDRILVLIDGVPYYETYNGKLDLNQFTTDNVAKIEVIKGAASVLYGANALGGVINIVTKKAAAGKPFFEVNLEGGQVDYYKESFSHGMKKGIFSYWLNYEHRQSRGWRMSDSYKPGQANITTQKYDAKKKKNVTTNSTAVTEDGGTREQSDYKSDSIWAKFGIEPAAGSEYFVNFHYIKKEKGIPPSTTGYPSAIQVFPDKPAFSNFFRYPEYNDWGIDLSGQQKVTERLSFKAKLFYQNHTDELTSYSDQTYINEMATSSYEDYLIGGYLVGEYKLCDWNTARGSFNYRGDSHKQRDDVYLPFASFFSYTGSVGIEDEMRFSNNFSTVIGASYDWFDVTQAQQNNTDKSGNFTGQDEMAKPESQHGVNPMIGADYKFADSTKLFASAAKKTRFPTLSNLFSSSKRGGNKDLKAESAINYTAGVSRSFSKYAFGEVAFFYHDISDYIMRPSQNDVLQNFGKIRIYGVEVSSEFYPLEALILKLGYTYNNASDQSSNRVTDQVAYVPENTLNVGVQYTIPYIKTRVDLNGLAMANMCTQVPTPSSPTQQEVYTAGYFVLNGRLTQKIMNNIEVYVAANNLFDTGYDSEPGYPALGRNIYGGITFKF